MKHVTISAFAALALALGGGCTKKADAPASSGPAVDEHDKGMADKGGKHDEHAGMPPELTKFHDLIKPIWHADAGDARTAAACAAVPALQAQADAVAKMAQPPKADPAKWTAATKELVDAAAAMKDPCDKKDQPAFDAAFKRVHEGFHGALEATGGGGEGGGEHEHEHEHKPS